LEYQLEVARRGAYLSFDRINNPDQVSDDTRLDLLQPRPHPRGCGAAQAGGDGLFGLRTHNAAGGGRRQSGVSGWAPKLKIEREGHRTRAGRIETILYQPGLI
jgi:hypothetical protein